MNIIEFMDHDYHESFKRLAQAYADAERTSCNQTIGATNGLINQTQTLHFENDLHYFLSEFSSVFTHPPEFNFVPFGDDDVMEYKVNMKDVFLKAQEVVKNITVEINNLQASIDEDTKTIEHMSSKNLQKYKVKSIDDALGVLEEAGEPIPPENPSKTSSLDRGNLPQSTRGVLALHNSQKGKEDTFSFTLGVFSRKLFRAAQLNVSTAKLRIVDKSLSEQKVPPVSVDGDYRVPKLFGGDCLEYIMVHLSITCLHSFIYT
ncbi:PREDICTED: uncharacterized protein LOC105315823, partial [Amphimedon queenslandica]|uniref:Uncharacterized protein n=2 Tax=Amphimedon queenslandica TaxID=400682 RepID=A0AAN0ISW6_AMPQE